MSKTQAAPGDTAPRDASATSHDATAIPLNGLSGPRLLEALPDAAFVAQDGRILFVNSACLAQFGANASEELIGRLWHDFVAEDRTDPLHWPVPASYSEREESLLELQRWRRLDGTHFPAEVAIAPLSLSGAAAVLIQVRDLSGRIQAEEYYRQLIEISPDATYVHRNGLFEFINPAGVRLFGAASAEELIGRDTMDFVHPDYRALILAHRQGDRDARSATDRMPQRRLRIDGTVFWAQVNAIPLDRTGIRSALVTLRDITDQKLAQEALTAKSALMEAVLDSISEGLWVFDEDLRLIAWNKALIDLLDYPIEMARVGTPFAEFMRYAIARGDFGPGDPEAILAERVETTKRRDPFAFERRAPDGKILEVRYSPIPGIGFVCTIADITQRRTYEDDLSALNGRLIDQTDELKRSNEELEQFAYVASHDLQEPLRSVSSYCQLLQRRYADKLDSDANEFIGFAVEGANRMQQLIGDLLRYSRVGSRGRPFETFDLGALLNEVKANLERALAESGATLIVDALPTICADRVQIGQLLQNLIGNALKFRREDPPRVEIGCEQRGGEIAFYVRDNGIGIEPQYADRIFQIFQRLHTRDVYPGTGIGLAICKKIVERHGGRLWVESEYGTGSTFCFTLLYPSYFKSVDGDEAAGRNDT